MPGVMQIRRITVCALLLMLGFLGSAAYASDEEQPRPYPRHHLAFFVGGNYERDDKGHEEDGYVLGFVYELQFREKWGIGAAIEELYRSDNHRRARAYAIPVSYHANEKWRFFAGPGLETGHEDKFFVRVGVSREFELNERWAVSPEFLVDFIESGAQTYALGFSIGYIF
jgi:hypothetical protein